MSSNHDDQLTIREYLLGELNEDSRHEFEQRLLTDDELFEELLVGEDELVDQYLSGELGKDEVAMFENRFLATSGRQHKLRFAKAFRKYAEAHGSDDPKSVLRPLRPTNNWQQFFSASPWRVAALAAVILVAALGIWRIYFYQSDVDKGLIALNAAYREQRPVEARITRFDYAPYVTTRGGEPERVNSLERERAERLLLDAVRDHPGAASYHALGKFYLAKKDFEKAISQFEEALKADPNNAQIYADLGAAWLEKGKLELEKAKSDSKNSEAGKALEDLGRSLENLNKALELDGSLLPAFFNRALCYQYMMLPAQAEEAWRTYLQKDSSSRWAEEARRNLAVLEEQRKKTSRSKDQLLQDFLTAYETRDDEGAWSAISRSRERKGNFIVEQLLDDYLSLAAAADQTRAANKLRMLSYEGEVEKQRAGDLFTSNLIRFYQNASEVQRDLSTQARQVMKAASSCYYKAEFEQALDLYSKANKAFITAGNVCEALFAESWVGYCYLRIPKVKESLATFEHLSRVFEAANYRSLFAQSLNALSDAQLTVNEFSKALSYANRSWQLSDEIEDRTNSIRSLGQIVSIQLNLGSYPESLNSTFKGLDLAESTAFDATLLWHFYHEAALAYHFEKLSAAALGYEKEAARLADISNNPLLKARSLDRLALFYEQAGDYATAIDLLNRALREAETISGESSKAVTQVHTALSLAQLYHESGNLLQAIDYYDRSLALSRKLNNLEIYLYRAHKGKFRALAGLHDDDAAAQELGVVLSLFEDYRNKITEESYRDKFFDVGQNTYDLAVDFEYSKQGNADKAFQYAEAYRARSLFDLMSGSSSVLDGADRPDISLIPGTQPLERSEIQSRMAQGAQILEYSVLDDKVVMWVVTRSGFEHAEAKITAPDLNDKIADYLDAISGSRRNSAQELNTARELYTSLISPVESRGYLNPNRQLCIVPDKNLNFLPFAALVSPASGKHLVETYALQVAPSATVFLAGSENAKQRERNGPERLLSVGNPHFDRALFNNLPDLPAADREARELGRYYQRTKLLVENEATLARVRQSLPEADVVHLATHAITDERSPLLSRLLLTNEPEADELAHHSLRSFIQASDIYKIRLPRTRLVVLSACRSGIERSYRGEGAIGFARAFIAAGVPLVVASLWPVNSETTADLMISFHKHRTQDKLSTVEALRQAQVEMLRSPQESSREPYAWAAFTVIGGYAQF